MFTKIKIRKILLHKPSGQNRSQTTMTQEVTDICSQGCEEVGICYEVRKDRSTDPWDQGALCKQPGVQGWREPTAWFLRAVEELRTWFGVR